MVNSQTAECPAALGLSIGLSVFPKLAAIKIKKEVHKQRGFFSALFSCISSYFYFPFLTSSFASLIVVVRFGRTFKKLYPCSVVFARYPEAGTVSRRIVVRSECIAGRTRCALSREFLLFTYIKAARDEGKLPRYGATGYFYSNFSRGTL
jgi:hypothetical protein